MTDQPILNAEDMAFLRRRERRMRAWPLAGSLLFLLLAALVAWLFLSRPLLVDPHELVRQLRSGTIDTATIYLLAGLFPLAFLVLMSFGFAFLALSFSAMSNERRLIQILVGLLRQPRAEHGSSKGV
jgi:hypothetical protein